MEAGLLNMRASLEGEDAGSLRTRASSDGSAILITAPVPGPALL
jgi:hypothetical protein